MTRDRHSSRPLSPADVLRLAVRRRRLLFSTALAGVAAAVGLGLLQRPKFEATTTILLDPLARGGLLGGVPMLAPMIDSSSASGDVAVLRSRTVSANTVQAPEPWPEGLGGPDARRHLGLSTLVTDESLTVWSLFWKELFERDAPRPAVQPEYRLFARAQRRSGDAPRVVRVEMRRADLVAIRRPGLLRDLGLGDAEEVELAFTPGEPFDYQGLELVLVPEGDVTGRTFLIESVPEHQAIEDLLERFWAVETTRSSGVLRVTVTDTDPFRVAETADALAQNYLVEQRARSGQRASSTVAYIEGMLAESRAAMAEAEAEVLRIRSEHPETIAIDAASEAVIGQGSALELQAAQHALGALALEDLLAALDEGDQTALARLDTAVAGGLVVDPVTGGYLGRIAALNAQYAELSQVYTEGHPRMTELRNSAAELFALVKEQLQGRAAGLRAQEAEAQRAAAEFRGRLGSLPEEMRDIAGPLFVLEAQKILIPELLSHLSATEIAESSSAFAARVLDPAVPAEHVASPRLLPLAIIGAALGLVAALFLALAREPRHGRIAGPADLADTALAPLVGTIALDARGGRGLESDPDTLDAVRSLRAAVKNLRADGAAIRRLGVTSVGGAEGRERVTAALADAFARQGARVALVEADLAERRLSELFGLSTGPGLGELLAEAPGGAKKRLRLAGGSGLEVLPAGEGGERSRDLLAGERFDALLAELLDGRDLVLVDLPAAGRSPDVESVAPKLDGLLLVCGQDRARRAALRDAEERIALAGGRVLGSVLLVPRSTAAPRG